MGELKGEPNTIEYSKIKIEDGTETHDGMLFSIPRGDDGGGPRIVYIVDLRVKDADCRIIRDKIKACMEGSQICPVCKWPVEVYSPIMHHYDGVREGFGCYCTFYKEAR